MEKSPTSDKSQTSLRSCLWYLFVIFLPIALFGIAGLAFYATIEYLHYLIGILLALILGIAAIGCISGVVQGIWIDKEENFLPAETFTMNISFSLTSIFFLITIGAWISYSLSALGIVELLQASGIPTYGNLVQTYLWHLVNMIPFTNVEMTFGMKEPIVQFTGWIAGLPILAFRFTVIVIIFGVIRDAWNIFQKSSEEALLQRIKKGIETDRIYDRVANLEMNLDRLGGSAQKLYVERKDCDAAKKTESITQESMNIMGILFEVFRESIKEVEEDKKHWLERLSEMNKVADELSDYLKELTYCTESLLGNGDDEEPKDDELKRIDSVIGEAMKHLDIAVRVAKKADEKNGILQYLLELKRNMGKLRLGLTSQ